MRCRIRRLALDQARGTDNVYLEGRAVAATIVISGAEVLESLGGAIPKNRIQCALLPITALRGAMRVEGD
jgi:hypothetical protein